MLQTSVVREFSNMGHDGDRRRFPGFATRERLHSKTLAPRDAHRIELRNGDLLSLQAPLAAQNAVLLVFAANGEVSPDLLGLKPNSRLQANQFQTDALCGWIAANGGDTAKDWPATKVEIGDVQVLRAQSACTLWVVRPITTENLIAVSEIGQLLVTHTPASGNRDDLMPPYLGEVRDEFTVARGTADSYEVQPGEIVQIIDVEGQQCSDFTALRSDALALGLEREIDGTATRSMVRGAYPGPGLFDKFFDRDLKPMMRLIQDTCGRHDTFGMACTARGYEERGFPGHVNCSDNISGALERFGVERRVAWPAINFFWNTWVDPMSNQLMTSESHSRPGDYVALLAMDRLVCVSTACPDDLDPINGWNPTDVHVRIY